MSDVKQGVGVDGMVAEAEKAFGHWEVAKDLVDEMIDLMLNYRQSGHPGGSRSKVHALLATLLSGAMRWDLRRPWRRHCDRFVLSAGHTIPLVYGTLAVLNEAYRARHERTGDDLFAFPDDGKYALTWEDLTVLRRRGGLAGHAEMEGKTLFIKFNTGPSGHGMPPTPACLSASASPAAGGMLWPEGPVLNLMNSVLPSISAWPARPPRSRKPRRSSHTSCRSAARGTS